jgi:hypothetical protein
VSASRPAAEIPEPSESNAEAPPAARLELTRDELEVIRRVRDSLRSIRFGTVLMVVQDGRVMQIETAEKIRLR